MSKSIKLYTDDNAISNELKQLKSSLKTYQRLLEGMLLLGNFTYSAKVEEYERTEKDQETKRKVFCTDLNGDLIMFYSSSIDKKDYLKISKVTYDGEKQYDLALAKKFELTPENIELTRTDKVNSFKYGRLITDNKTFYTLLLGNDIIYKIEIEKPNMGIAAQNILNMLNSLDSIPSLMDYVEILNRLINDNKLEYESIKTDMYQEFKKVCSYTIEGNKKNQETDPKKLV